jgi:hypothetical protein
MISKADTDWVVEQKDFGDVMEFLISDDRLELIEMVVDRMKNMEVGESVMINLVMEKDEKDEVWMEDSYLRGNCIEKNEIIYTIKSGFNEN